MHIVDFPQQQQNYKGHGQAVGGQQIICERQEDARKIVPVKGEGRILLMDDEEDIRVLAQEMLSKLGCDVSVAEDGDEAIEMSTVLQDVLSTDHHRRL